MAVRFVNLTPHDIVFVGSENETLLVVKPEGVVARLTAATVDTGVSYNGIPVTCTEYGAVQGLPQPEENTIFIVSSLVAQQCRDRSDVFIPSESVRDENGRIVGCRSLGRI